jgi:hypothetical protein
MSRAIRDRLFGVVMLWTGMTTVFAWLPLARIIGRPVGYTWGILGLSGSGSDGPFWVFMLATAYVVTMLYCAFRGPRALFYPMLAAWHLFASGIVIAAVAGGGTGAVFQGQGLHFAIPMWLLTVPFVLFTAAVLTWIVVDYRSGAAVPSAPWSRTNTAWLLGSMILLVIALALFRAGTNYNWVTAAAIVTAIGQWILMIQSFAPVVRAARGH